MVVLIYISWVILSLAYIFMVNVYKVFPFLLDLLDFHILEVLLLIFYFSYLFKLLIFC